MLCWNTWPLQVSAPPRWKLGLGCAGQCSSWRLIAGATTRTLTVAQDVCISASLWGDVGHYVFFQPVTRFPIWIWLLAYSYFGNVAAIQHQVLHTGSLFSFETCVKGPIRVHVFNSLWLNQAWIQLYLHIHLTQDMVPSRIQIPQTTSDFDPLKTIECPPKRDQFKRKDRPKTIKFEGLA